LSNSAHEDLLIRDREASRAVRSAGRSDAGWAALAV